MYPATKDTSFPQVLHSNDVCYIGKSIIWRKRLHGWHVVFSNFSTNLVIIEFVFPVFGNPLPTFVGGKTRLGHNLLGGYANDSFPPEALLLCEFCIDFSGFSQRNHTAELKMLIKFTEVCDDVFSELFGGSASTSRWGSAE